MSIEDWTSQSVSIFDKDSDPIADIKKELDKAKFYSLAEVGITHPYNTSSVKVKNNGMVHIFTATNQGIIVDPKTMTINLITNHIKENSTDKSTFLNGNHFEHCQKDWTLNIDGNAKVFIKKDADVKVHGNSKFYCAKNIDLKAERTIKIDCNSIYINTDRFDVTTKVWTAYADRYDHN